MFLSHLNITGENQSFSILVAREARLLIKRWLSSKLDPNEVGFPCWGQTKYILSFNKVCIYVPNTCVILSHVRLLLLIDMSRATYQYTREQVRTQILIRLATSKIIQWLKIIKKVVFAIKDAHWYKNTMLQISVTRGFAGTITRPVFLGLQMTQHDLDFQTGENGKTIILFFFSFVMDCMVVVKLPWSCL